MSRPLKTPSTRWDEFAFCSSGYVLVLLYTLGALGLNCEREQRWRAFVTPPPHRERPSRRARPSSRHRRLGRRSASAARRRLRPPRGAAPGRCGLRPGAAPVARAIRARDPGDNPTGLATQVRTHVTRAS